MAAAGNVSRAFHKDLYLKAAITEAVEAYEDFAAMQVTGDEADAWTVTFADVDEDFDAEMLASEFANFVLASTIDRKR